ncbi:MAG: hypothetical protein RSC43_00080 [Clostridia bacterium]
MKQLSINCVVTVSDDVFNMYTEGCTASCTPLGIYTVDDHGTERLAFILSQYLALRSNMLSVPLTRMPQVTGLEETNRLLSGIAETLSCLAVQTPTVHMPSNAPVIEEIRAVPIQPAPKPIPQPTNLKAAPPIIIPYEQHEEEIPGARPVYEDVASFNDMSVEADLFEELPVLQVTEEPVHLTMPLPGVQQVHTQETPPAPTFIPEPLPVQTQEPEPIPVPTSVPEPELIPEPEPIPEPAPAPEPPPAPETIPEPAPQPQPQPTKPAEPTTLNLSPEILARLRGGFLATGK